MRCLVIKTSSLGDLVHTFPALTDAAKAIPGIEFDWVAEEAFTDLPKLHPKVNTIFPVAIRRWRKAPFKTEHRQEMKDFFRGLKAQKYDAVIDAQGLLKSALITKLSRGTKHGLNFHSAREPLSALVYQKTHEIAKNQHAIQRTRLLFAQALGYECALDAPDYGLNIQYQPQTQVTPRVLFLHGTTWRTKEWPEPYWRQLAELFTNAGFEVLLPWGNAEEKARGERIAEHAKGARLLPKMDLNELSKQLTSVKGVVAVDTGIGHLAAALEVPTLSLYGATNKDRTGTLGKRQQHIQSRLSCSPCLKRKCIYEETTNDAFPKCFESITPNQVFNGLIQMIEGDSQ